MTKKVVNICSKFVVIILLVINTVMLTTLYNTFKPQVQAKGTTRYYLYHDYYDALKDEDKTKILELIKGSSLGVSDIVNEEFFTNNGKSINELTFTTKDKTISPLDIEGPICIQVVADWCEYCQKETAIYLDEMISEHPDCTFVQLMASGNQEQFDAFYKTINKQPNESLILAYNNVDFVNLFKGVQMSYPSMIFVNSDHKISGYAVGMLTPELFDAYYKVANNICTYELETKNNERFSEITNKISFAKKYIEKLEYIDIPDNYKDEN